MEKEQVKQLIECMVVVSQADGLHDEEINFITNMLQPLWNESHDTLVGFVHSIISTHPPKDKFLTNAKILSQKVKGPERQLMINLMQKLMLSDGIFTHQEKEYYVEFQKLFK